MPSTTNRNWTFPVYRKKPYYSEIVSLYNEIDADVENIDQKIDSANSDIQTAEDRITDVEDRATDIEEKIVNIDSTASSGHAVINTPSSVIADGDLSNSQIGPSLDETYGNLVIKAKDSAGGIQLFNIITGGFQELITADDTDTTITAAFKNNIVFVGTGTLQWAVLDTATTFKKFRQFKFLNSSSEICGVRNSDSTVWVRLGPHESCICTLVDNTTAVGVWHVVINRISDPRYGVYVIDDFMGGSAFGAGPLGFSGVNSGAGATAAIIEVVAGSYSTGIMYQTTGTTSAGSSVITSTPGIQLGVGPVRYVDTVIVIDLAVVGDEYVMRFGLCDGDAVDAVDGAYFEYDRLTHGDDNLRICTSSNSTRTKADSGVTPKRTLAGAGIFQIPSIEVNSVADRVDFFLDKTHVGTSVANIPSGASRLTKIQKSIIKSAGSKRSYCYCDFVSLAYYYSRY